MNKEWSRANSTTTKERLDKDNKEWFYYHSLYKESRKTWAEIPYMEMAEKLKKEPTWIVGDFGCGENLLSKEITNKVHSFDYVAIDENVIACDVSNVPLDDNTLNCAIFSLSLMGHNYLDYIREAYRTVRPYGFIFVCEPATKWKDRENELKEAIESVGFRCLGATKNTESLFILME